ncbi:hypothetical protein ACLKMY_16005 [Paraburkholderia mimosarum]
MVKSGKQQAIAPPFHEGRPIIKPTPMLRFPDGNHGALNKTGLLSAKR